MNVDHTSNRVRRLSSIDEYGMRNAVFQEFFSTLSDSKLTELFVRLENGLRNQTAASRSIVHSLFLYWTQQWATWIDRFAPLPSTPLIATLRHHTQYAPLDAWKMVKPNANLFADDKVLTLGERRALARRPDRRQVEAHLYDPDRKVIEHLLQNAKITEVDVIRIAVRRPTTGEALLSVFESRRFGLSKQIMMALLQNPFLPYQAGVGLSFLLSKSELNQLRQVHSLSPIMKQFIRHRFEQLA